MGAKSLKINKSKSVQVTYDTTGIDPDMLATVNAQVESGEIKLNDYKNIYSAGNMGKVWPKDNSTLVALIAHASDQIEGDGIDEGTWLTMLTAVADGASVIDAVDSVCEGDVDETETETETPETTPEEKVIIQPETPAEAATKRERALAVARAATETATKAAADVTLNAHLAVASESDDVKRNIAVRACVDMLHLYATPVLDSETNRVTFKDNAMAGWPMIGSVMKDVKPGENNLLFDEYEYKEGETTVKGSWSETFATTFPFVKALKDEVTLINVALNDNAIKPAAYKNTAYWTKSRLESLKGRKERAARNAVKYVREAIKLYQRMEKINELCPELFATFAWQPDLAQATMPPVQKDGRYVLAGLGDLVEIWQPRLLVKRPTKAKDVLRVDIDKLVKGGGHLEAFDAAVPKVVKAAPKKSEEEAKAYPPVTDIVSLALALGSVTNYMDGIKSLADRTAFNTTVTQTLAADGGSDLAYLIGEAFETISTLWKMPGVQKMYTARKEQEGKEATAKLDAAKERGAA